MNLVKQAELFVNDLLSNKLDKRYYYHNIDHTMLVYASANELAIEAKLVNEEKEILLLSALFHDTGFTISYDNHEAHSIALAKEFLIQHDVKEQTIERILDCIAATELGVVTTDPLALLLQDADMSGLAHNNFKAISNRLRKEKNEILGNQISKNEWRKTNVQFLSACVYHTGAAQKLYSRGKEKNKEALISSLKKKNKKGTKIETITTSKSAQTQFKTALRNHIDLSNIADNKANIMISVNALILTVALPFLIDRALDNHHFWVSTIIIGLVCLISMVFATLATRPIHMSGITTDIQIKENTSNLFFFGNYFKMDFLDYSQKIKKVITDSEKLDESIIADLFHLGKSLGKKFSYLRLCYNVFMFGIGLAVLSLFVAYFIN